ncbi:MAG: membrane protein, partial [Maribacter sp.]
MSLEIEERLEKIPVVNWFVRLLKEIRLPGFKGLSIYDLSEMYVVGILQGTLSTRASAIAFSLFMALFPLLIFMVTLVPYLFEYVSIQNADFEGQFQLFLESFLPTATGEYFGEVFQQIKDQKRGGLLSSAFILSIFLVANGVNAIFGGFETSYHIELTRNFFRQYLFALMVGLILAILIILGFVMFIYFEVYVLVYLDEFQARLGGYVMEDGDRTGVQVVKVLFFVV